MLYFWQQQMHSLLSAGLWTWRSFKWFTEVMRCPALTFLLPAAMEVKFAPMLLNLLEKKKNTRLESLNSSISLRMMIHAAHYEQYARRL